MNRIALFGLGLMALSSTGCATNQTKRTVGETTLSGTTALSSYAATPRSVVATDETGRATSAPLAADGFFSLTLKRAHTYHVDVITDAGAVPLVFPRASGNITRTFALKSDGARLSLGAVRFVHVPVVVPVEARIAKASALRTASLGDSEANDDGPNDGEDVQCGDGSHGDGQHSDDMEGGDDKAETASDVSVAEHNVPENVDGCGVDDDNADDRESNDD